MRKTLHLLFACIFIHPIAEAQRMNVSDRRMVERLQTDLSILASDSMEGRRAGTSSEARAHRYISAAFAAIGLEPKGNGGSYLQSFPIADGKRIMPPTLIEIEGKSLTIPVESYPLSISGNARVSAMNVIADVKEVGQPWFIDIHTILEDHNQHPHFDWLAGLLEKSESARKKGATAIIWYDTSSVSTPIPRFDPAYNGPTVDIPVVFIGRAGLDKAGFSTDSAYDISLHVQIERSYRTAHNVVAYLDRKAPYTVILGAHYDHLGYGEDGNSMQRNGPPAIHNGADDNASGTSALLELARHYAVQSRFKHFNILFIAFSGEELGLLGSRHFTQNPTIDLNRVSFMINMDMVGRLSDSTRSITVGGYGTSPSWSAIIGHSNPHDLVLRFDSSGTGPSDHTSFYRKDIPVLFFFTGLHTDYHKPSDDADRINTRGMVRVIRFIQEIINHSDGSTRLPFSRTREQQTSTNTRFTVSLGIMPDYSFTGNGVRIDGVSEGRAAKKAGILAGDVLIALGAQKVTSVESYMQALSRYKKGDATQVTVQRKESLITFDIIF